MESQRAFPLPAFPTSLNVFYHSPPRAFKDSFSNSCNYQAHHDIISKKVLLKRRFPRIDYESVHSSISPKSSQNYLRLTFQSTTKTRSISPLKDPIFKPCNFQEAKSKISRKVCAFKGNPYLDCHDISLKEYQEAVKKRLGGTFKYAINEKYLTDHKAYINSQNTFKTFNSGFSEDQEMKATSLFMNSARGN